MKFQKGNKFAKGGARPGAGRKPDEYKARLKAQLAKAKADPLTIIRQLMTSKTVPEQVRLRAAIDLADRLYGRAPTSLEATLRGEIEHGGGAEIRVVFTDQLPQPNANDD